jgi:hypothetical protein
MADRSPYAANLALLAMIGGIAGIVLFVYWEKSHATRRDQCARWEPRISALLDGLEHEDQRATGLAKTAIWNHLESHDLGFELAGERKQLDRAMMAAGRSGAGSEERRDLAVVIRQMADRCKAIR